MKAALLALLMSATLVSATPVLPIKGDVSKYVTRVGYVHHPIHHPNRGLVVFVKVGINEFKDYELPENTNLKAGTYVSVKMNTKKTYKWNDDTIVKVSKSNKSKKDKLLYKFANAVNKIYRKDR